VLAPAAWAAAVAATLNVGPHWDSHPAPRGASAPRVLVVADTTGDARVRAALREFTRRWNGMVTHGELRAAGLPRVRVAAVPRSRGCRPAKAARGRRASDVVVCRDDSLATAGVGGPYAVDESGHTRFGIVKLRRATLAWSPCNLRTAITHEMGHVMGLPHNDTEAPARPSVMMSGNGPYHHGCPTWFSAGDLRALQTLYDRAD
jgi:hypothetical protein